MFADRSLENRATAQPGRSLLTLPATSLPGKRPSADLIRRGVQWGSLRVSISAWATSRSLVLVSWDYRLRMANARSSTSYRSHQDPHGLADEFPGIDRCRRDR